MKTINLQTLKELLAKADIHKITVRLINAWLTVSTCELLFSAYSFTDMNFFSTINMALHLIFTAELFCLYMLFNRPKLDRILLMVTSVIYFSASAVQDGNIYFLTGCCAVLSGIFVYAYDGRMSFRLKKWQTFTLLGAIGILFTLFVGVITTTRYLSYWTPCFDFGIFSQMFYYMKETFQPLTTCERDTLLSHYAVHFSPIFYLLLPLYYIFPSPVTLLFGQAIVLASGLIPLYLICKKHSFSNLTTVLVSVCYMLMPSVIGGNFYYIHENNFLAPLLFWMIYFIEREKSYGWCLLSALLVMFVKEDAPVYVAVLALYFIVSKTNVKKGSALLVFSITYFLAVTYLMKKYGEGIMVGRYSNFMYDGSDSLTTVIKAIILNPIYALSESIKEENFTFILQMLLPLAFLPLMMKKPSRILLLIPLFVVNLMSTHEYQHNIGYQYTFGTAAFLIYLLILNFGDIDAKLRKKILTIAVACSVVMFFGTHYSKIDFIKTYDNYTEERVVIREALAQIPPDASVKCTTFLLPNLSNRREVYELETTKHNDTDYVAIDLRYTSEEYNPYDYLNDNYEVVAFQENKIVVFKAVK